MNRSWLGFGLVVVILVAGILMTWVPAVRGVFQPGSQLYGWQLASERLYEGVLQDAAKAGYKLELTERRFADLVHAAGTSAEGEAFLAFDLALESGIQGFDLATEESQTALRAPMVVLASQVQEAGRYLRPVVEDSIALERLEARMRYITAWAEDPDVSLELLETAAAADWDELALHAKFPLEAGHQEAACEDCHFEKAYAFIASDCSGCHRDERPDPHFPGECSLCHTETVWDPGVFPHPETASLDCAACHAGRAPEDHFQAQCSACHEIEGWEAVKFNHAAVDSADCGGCHQEDRPESHFPGDCSLCHGIDGWTDAGFEHLSVDSCGSCHEGSRPADHFPGDCTACHTPGNWVGAVFNHQGVESCVQCHETRRPAGHFEGDCSLCHRPGSFADATFNHEGAVDCLACHGEDRSSGHFERQCSQCHNTDGWSNPVYSHTFPRNHGGANPNSCGTCHAAGLGSYTCFACHDAGKIDEEHRDEGVNYHANCAACHPRGDD